MRRVKISNKIICTSIVIVCSFVVAVSLIRTNKPFMTYLKTMNGNSNELQGEITFVSNRTDKAIEIKELIAQFEKENPGVTVNKELMGDVESVLQLRASVGELPDVTLVPGNIGKAEYHKYFLSIDDLGFDNTNIYNYYMGTGEDNALYCLNSSINWQGIIYNKEIFKEAGIDKIPTTINELFDACKKIKAIGKTPIAVNYSQTWTMNLWVDVIPHLFDNNLEINTLINNQDILGKSNGMYKSLNLVREIVKNGFCEETLTNYDWQKFKNDMSNGEIAMTIWSSDFKYQLEDMGMNPEIIGMFPIPETETVKIYGDYKFAISKNTENPELAKAFLKYIFEEDRYVNAVNTMSPLRNSEKNIKAFEELSEYEIPIVFYSDFVNSMSVEKADIVEKFANMKKVNEIEYQFVQRYIREDDLNSLTDGLEKKWDQSLEN